MGTSSGKMTIRDATDYLASKGYHCSVGTVRALVKANKLACHRPGVSGKGPMQFKPDWLDSFLERAVVGAGETRPTRPDRPAREPRPKAMPAPAAVATEVRAAAWQAKMDEAMRS